MVTSDVHKAGYYILTFLRAICKNHCEKQSVFVYFSRADRGFPGENLIFHSDQGSQYTARAFRQLLKKLKITQSFSNAGTPHDNAVMESFFSTFKKEEFYRSKYRSEKELRNKIEEYILFYNQKRPHTTLNYKTPEQYEDEYFQKLKNSIYGIEGSNF